MGLLEKIKNILTIPEEDEFEEDFTEVAEEEPRKKAPSVDTFSRRTEPTPRVIGGGKSKTVNLNAAQMQVVLVKPERYEDVTAIADHLNDRKSVVLNLESADRETSRRIVDFLSGATYANHGNIKKVSRGTFLIVPNGVDMMGEVMFEDFEDGSMYL